MAKDELQVEGDDAFVLQNLSCPANIMRFHLVYHGRLSGSGNSPKPDQVRDVRDTLHPQLEYLWQTHTALKRLRQSAIVFKNPEGIFSLSPDSPFSPKRDVEKFPAKEYEVDLCSHVVERGRSYVPLVRRSLDLCCHININFLRQEDPGSLVLQGGDLDNRIKTLFDALRKPEADIAERFPQKQDPTYCLLESDTLISGFDVSTDRLLFPKTEYPNEVHILMEVIVRVLRVGAWNVCLVGN